MNAKRLLRIALVNLWQKPLRTLLTMLGIIIGGASVVALMSVGSATTSSVTSQIQQLGTNLLVITPGQTSQNGVSQGLGTAQTLSLADVTQLQKEPAISGVAPDVTSRAQLSYQSTNYQTRVEGSTPDLFTVRNLPLSAGRYFNIVEEQQAANVAVIGPTTAQNVFGTVNPVGKTMWVNGLPFQVVGELASQGSSGSTNNDDEIIIPLTTLQDRISGSTYLSTIYVSAASASQMTAAEQQAELAMRQSHGLSYGASDDFTVTNQATLLGTLQGVTKTLQAFLGGIAGISLLVGGIGIMNIMLVSVTERTREIGLRKALGATRQTILYQFLIESGLVGFVGGIVGVGIGALTALTLGRLVSSTVEVNWTGVWIAFVVSFLVGVIFGVYPASRASKLSPIHALRYE